MNTKKQSPKKKTVLITGGLGFIGSAFAWYLNYIDEENMNDEKKNIILCDYFRSREKWKNALGIHFTDIITPEQAADYILGKLPGQKNQPETVVHLGACSSTTEEDMDFLFRNNYEFSKTLWQVATDTGTPFYYASSAATYGKGSKRDDFSCRLPLSNLRPLNKYGYSKQLFDLWVERQISEGNTPPKHKYGGLKFFNVFGPQEYHKRSMASVVFHAYHQIKTTEKVKLFKSYHKDYPDGGQVRDFVYIKDICHDMYRIIFTDGLYNKKFLHNLGSGTPHTFVDLVTSIFTALKLKPNIEFIEMPEPLRPNYQYFTQAEINNPQDKLEPAVIDYVRHLEEEPYLSYNNKDPYLG